MGIKTEPVVQGDFKIMAHQVEAIDFLLQKKCGLVALEQGLGKSMVAIKAFASVRREGRAEALLIVCPNSLKRNWVAELERFEPGLTVQIVEGSARARRKALATISKNVTVMSYETARTEITGVLAMLSRKQTVLVLDESHAVKNRFSLTSTAVRHFAFNCQYRWLLSGTPVTNTAADLYAQIGIIAGGRPLGSFHSFLATYGSNEGAAMLKAKIAPFVLRRTKKDCLDLPDKLFVDIKVELPAWQRKLYTDMRDDLVCQTEKMTGEEFRAYASTALAKLLRLSQILILPTEPHVPVKFVEIDNLVDEIIRSGTDKVIIWSHYVGTIRALVGRYQSVGCVALYGEVPAAERQGIAKQFQEDSRVRVLVGNPAAAGTGFTLTAAKYAIYETLSWRYDFYAQSQDRIHRIGQEQPVTYVRLIATDTIEEVICEALERKAALARALLGDATTVSEIVALTPQGFCQMLLDNKIPKAG
jgi:SNF2 family DNA or RNA helicase